MSPSTRQVPAGGDSRQRMLEAAIVLLRRTGLSGAGMNTILKESGAPKGSMYYFFPDGKHQLVSEAVGIYRGRVAETLQSGLSGSQSPGVRVRNLFDVLAKRISDADFCQSCAVGAIALDLDEDTVALRPLLEAVIAGWIDVIAGQLPSPTSKRTRTFAGLVMTVIQGAYIRARLTRSTEPLREAGEWLGSLADQALGQA